MQICLTMSHNFDEIIPRLNTACYKYDKLNALFGSEDLIPLWVADMDFHTPDFVVEAIKKRASHEIYGYTFRPTSYEDAVIGWYKQRHGWEIKREWLAFSPGVVPALNMLVMSLTEPGDEIIVQPPVYAPFFGAVNDHQRKLVLNPLLCAKGHYAFDFQQLEKIISVRTRMLILCSPHNPVGRVWSRQELNRLAEICMRNNLLILSDEIHCDLVLPPNRHVPVATLSDEIAKNTITTISASKTFNLAGLATASVVIPDPGLKVKYEQLLAKLHLGMGNLFGALAAEAAYNHGNEWLDQLLDYLSQNFDFICNYLAQHLPAIKAFPLEGTYLAWLDFRRAGFSSHTELKTFMVQHAGIALSEGDTFGMGGDGFMRLNLACPRATLEKALARLRNAYVAYFSA